ncbi:MAG: ATP-binding protein [Gemmatimonadota bacterium]
MLTRLLVAFSVFAVLIGAATTVNYVAVGRQNAVAQQVTGRYTLLQQEETALEEAYGTAQFAIIFYDVTRDHRYLAPLGTVRASFYQTLAALRRDATPGLRGLIEIQDRAGDSWFALAPTVASVTPRTPAARAVYAHSNRLSVEFLTALTGALIRLHSDIERLTASSKHALRTGLVWSAVALAVAVLLVLVLSLSTVYSITRPLRALTATVGRLTRGDHGARAEVRGSPEVREVAQSVNVQADEADRLRRAEAESGRLRAAAREAGLRIREPLAEVEVLRAARLALEQTVDADRVAVRLISGSQLSTPDGVGPEPWWPPTGARLGSGALARLHQLFRAQRSSVVQDVQGPEGDVIPADFREWVRRTGVVCQITTPFGVGQDLLGMLIVQRLTPGRPWTPAETDAVDSIAADLGRGLNHARLYEAEGRLVEDLKSLDRAKSDFFATVSHELRGPLTSIEGYVEMLGDDPDGRLDGEQRHMVQVIDRSAGRLHTLIEDVFTLAKLESQAFAAEKKPVPVAGVIGEAAEAVRPSAAEKQLDLTVTGADPGLVVAGDPEQLQRVVLNLLTNAVKFTPQGGRVSVSAGAGGGPVVITVRDTGIGIPQADQEDLFGRFFRASNAVDKGIPGTGLGLAIVRTIVVNHGGTISVESREGEGTAFTVRLPREAPPPA